MIVEIGTAFTPASHQFRLEAMQHPDRRALHCIERTAKLLEKKFGAIERGHRNDFGGVEVDPRDQCARVAQRNDLFQQDRKNLFAALGSKQAKRWTAFRSPFGCL